VIAGTTSSSICLRSSTGSDLWIGDSRFDQVGWPWSPALDAIQVREIAVRYAWAASIARGPVASRIALPTAEAHSAPVRPTLEDRRSESAVLGRLLAVVRAGRSGALVLRGEAGIGKAGAARVRDQVIVGCAGAAPGWGGGGDGIGVRGAASVVRSDA
jgi:hypothetical protein